MSASLEFILGLLDQEDPACVAAEDFAGPHGPILRQWQARGFLSREPGKNPLASCPSCGEGVPYRLRGRYLCPRCRSTVDPRHLLLWRFDLGAFLGWLGRSLKLTGSVQQVEERLWQLGSLPCGGVLYECFFCRSGPLTTRGHQRLLAYRNALLLQGLPHAVPMDGFRGPCLSLLEVLREGRRSLKVTDLIDLLRGQGAVRFEAGSGALYAGDVWLGEVPVGSKEYHLLACLAQPQHLDRYVPYADLKHYVLQHTGSTDSTEEATFCQRLKSRIKRFVPHIDRLIATTNKADGYRLRAHVEL